MLISFFFLASEDASGEFVEVIASFQILSDDKDFHCTSFARGVLACCTSVTYLIALNRVLSSGQVWYMYSRRFNYTVTVSDTAENVLSFIIVAQTSDTYHLSY